MFRKYAQHRQFLELLEGRETCPPVQTVAVKFPNPPPTPSSDATPEDRQLYIEPLEKYSANCQSMHLRAEAAENEEYSQWKLRNYNLIWAIRTSLCSAPLRAELWKSEDSAAVIYNKLNELYDSGGTLRRYTAWKDFHRLQMTENDTATEFIFAFEEKLSAMEEAGFDCVEEEVVQQFLSAIENLCEPFIMQHLYRTENLSFQDTKKAFLVWWRGLPK